MRFPRMTTRRWSAILALIAAALCVVRGGMLLAGKSAEYRRVAANHESRLRTLALIRREGQYPYAPCWLGSIPLQYDADSAPRHARHVTHHTALKRKYERASRYPWFPHRAGPADA